MLILGTEYAGEMKKGIFSVMHYMMPCRDILTLHSGCNVGKDDDTTLFFGLSGTGTAAGSAADIACVQCLLLLQPSVKPAMYVYTVCLHCHFPCMLMHMQPQLLASWCLDVLLLRLHAPAFEVASGPYACRELSFQPSLPCCCLDARALPKVADKLNKKIPCFRHERRNYFSVVMCAFL